VDFAILLGPGFIPIIENTSPLAGVLNIKHVSLYTKYMPKLKITASKTIWQDVDILSIRILVLPNFLLLLCFGRLLVQRQRKEATQVLYCASLGIV
jgi:hypothetical protein